MIFQVPGVSLEGQKWFKMGSESHLRRGSLGIPLGSLLDRSWSLLEPKKSNWDRLLGGQEAHQDEISATIGIRPGQHWERKAHHHAIERSDRFCASCEEINPIAL